MRLVRRFLAISCLTICPLLLTVSAIAGQTTDNQNSDSSHRHRNKETKKKSVARIGGGAAVGAVAGGLLGGGKGAAIGAGAGAGTGAIVDHHKKSEAKKKDEARRDN